MRSGGAAASQRLLLASSVARASAKQSYSRAAAMTTSSACRSSSLGRRGLPLLQLRLPSHQPSRRLLVTLTRRAPSPPSVGGIGLGQRKRPAVVVPRQSPPLPPQARGYFTRRPSFVPEGEGVVWAIIGANIAVFGAWTWASNSRKWTRFMTEHFTISPVGLLKEGRVHTIVTSMFSHKSFGHLLVNCVTLFFFGSEAALLLGARRFLNLYLSGGVVSSLCCVAWPYVAPRLDIPASYRVSKYTMALGASGAVNALVAWSILNFPTRLIYIYMVLPVPAALVGVLFLVKDLSGLYQGGGGEANAGHLGGAVVGAAYFLLGRGRF